jgi:uncharacterized OB-fold protein
MTELFTDTTSTTRGFREGLADHQLRYQRCEKCGHAQTLKRYVCVQCGCTDLRWRVACGNGTVRARSTVHRAPTDDFKALIPYTLVLVELNEGPRVMAHANTNVVIGSPVHATYFAHNGATLLRFEPQPSSEGALTQTQ